MCWPLGDRWRLGGIRLCVGRSVIGGGLGGIRLCVGRSVIGEGWEGLGRVMAAR